MMLTLQRGNLLMLTAMKKKVFTWTEGIATVDAIGFWTNAGYNQGKDFRIKMATDGRNVIEPKTQMFLAQDGIAFGFKIEEVELK
jgi:hypothetical protein